MRSKLQAHRPILSRAISSLAMSSLATRRTKFLPPPNPSSKRNLRAKNPPARISRRASRPLEGKANAVEAADAVEDADEVDEAASKPLRKPSVPPS